MQDSTASFQDQVRQATSDGQPLCIRGGGSKAFYGRPANGKTLDTAGHRGILEYEPTELILRARAGTTLAEVTATLQAKGQILACEPPCFGDNATFGGMVAAGLSGPARPYRAAVQDTVLGCTVMNGKGDILRFGGKVMKNVAGYDISRLMAGSMGCLGILLDITVKVIPCQAEDLTCRFSIDRDSSLAFGNELRRQGLPVTATCQTTDSELLVRFSAGSREIADIPGILEKRYGFVAREVHADNSFWTLLRDHRLPFFQDNRPLWRLSLPPGTDISALGPTEDSLITEWGGALHWLKTVLAQEAIHAFAASVNGQATLFRAGAGDKRDKVFQPLSVTLAGWHRNLKQAFDPAGILNPGRMYADF